MSKENSFTRYGYSSYQEFISINHINDDELMEICDLKAYSISRYKRGANSPPSACIKLVEMMKQGKMPYRDWRWSQIRINKFGILLPGMTKELELKDLMSFWVLHQTNTFVRNKADFYKRKLEEMKVAEDIEIIVKVNGKEHKSVDFKPFGDLHYDRVEIK